MSLALHCSQLPPHSEGLLAWPCSCSCSSRAGASWASLPSAHRYVVLFNPLEQERLSVVSLLVSSPRVRVLSEEGQPLAVQVSAHWSSATNMVPDVYQVRGAWHVGPRHGPLC